MKATPLVLAGLLLSAGAAYSFGQMSAVMLVLGGFALALCIFLIWSSLQSIDDSEQMSFEEALALGAPTATEEQKRAVIRALKDLEYERHVGKISDEDFKKVSAEYRKQAKELIAASDLSMADRVTAAEKRVKKHLKKAAKEEKKRQEEAKDNSEEEPEEASNTETESVTDREQEAPSQDDSEASESTSSEPAAQSSEDSSNSEEEDKE